METAIPDRGSLAKEYFERYEPHQEIVDWLRLDLVDLKAVEYVLERNYAISQIERKGNGHNFREFGLVYKTGSEV